MNQLALFPEAPGAAPAAPAPNHTAPLTRVPVAPAEPACGPSFIVAGWRVRRVGATWQATKPADSCWTAGAYCPRVLRAMLAHRSPALRVDDLPADLAARGFERDVRPGYDHWIHWPAGSYSACLATLELNIAACRRMRPPAEFLAEYRAEQAAKGKKKTRRAA